MSQKKKEKKKSTGYRSIVSEHEAKKKKKPTWVFEFDLDLEVRPREHGVDRGGEGPIHEHGVEEEQK